MTKRKTYKVITDYKARGFGKHLNNASKKGATLVALIGEDELQNGTIWVKDLSTKDEQTINLGDF